MPSRSKVAPKGTPAKMRNASKSNSPSKASPKANSAAKAVMPNRAAPRDEPFPSNGAGAEPNAAPVLNRDDVHRIINDLSRELAPGDVETIVADEDKTRRRIAALPGEFELFRNQITLALDCLRDHIEGECPQIPYYTIALLAAGVTYFGDELDVVPDFLPGGTLDDATVMALACEMAHEGLERYCTATGRETRGILFPPKPRSHA